MQDDSHKAMGEINSNTIDFDGTGKEMSIKIDNEELNRAGVKNAEEYLLDTTNTSMGFKTKEERDELNKRWDYLEKNYSGTSAMREYDNLKEKTSVINSKIKNEFDNTPSFFRGTTKEELDNYLSKGTIGGDKNQYNYVAVSTNPELTKTFANGVIVEYDGDSVRNYGTQVEYTARPQASGISKGVTHSEEIGGAMSVKYSPEREVRLPEKLPVKDLHIKNIHLLPPLNDNTRQGIKDKYSKLGNVIFHENSWEFKKVLK